MKKRVVLVAPKLSSFVKNDILILEKEYHVSTNVYDWTKKHLVPVFLLQQLFYFLFNIRKVDKVLIQFGGAWSLVPAVLCRLSNIDLYIVLHGTDCASLPDIQYGSLRKPFIRWCCGVSYKLATTLLPVSDSLISTKNLYHTDDNYSHQGFKSFYPTIKTSSFVIANGLDSDFWKPLLGIKREKDSFVSVFSKDQFILKGGDLIMQLAKKNSGAKFYIAGLNQPESLKYKPENVFFLGVLTREELRSLFSRTQFHFQLSIFEGFGLALCEAMLCQCIPIGSSSNAIPQIIGRSGYILERRAVDLLHDLIKKVISDAYNEDLGLSARNRIKEQFSLEKRATNLLSIMR